MRYLKVSIILAIILILTFSVGANIINIPDDYLTIQEGIDAAIDFDTVLVAPGHYVENINFNGKEIVLSSYFLYEKNTKYIFNTIIDGSNQTHPDTGSTVLIINGEGASTKLQGFTITGGTGTLYEWSAGNFDRKGGGVFLLNTFTTVQYNYICENKAVNNAGIYAAGGGGVQILQSSPKVLNNIIVNNEALYGAGMSIGYTDAVGRNNVIAYNYGGQIYSGSGIQINRANCTIENNTIVRNISTQAGAGIRVFSASPIIRNNIIWYNEAPNDAQINGYSHTLYCNVEGGDVWGDGNIDIEPHLTTDFCLFLSDNSPCIDAGDPSEIYFDIENPVITETAKWPSFGGLRNDIGAYGGLGAFPFNLIGVYADTTLGWVPLDVSFNAYTGSDIITWHWDFGDENNSNLQSPLHQYTSSGLYDATVQAITLTEDTLEQTIYGIAVLADTVRGDTVYGEVGHSVEVIVSGNNTLPINQIIIPFEYSGDLFLKYDSMSLSGCRTEYFGKITFLHIDIYNRRIAILIEFSLDGSPPDLPAGEGNLLKIYFTVSTYAVAGNTNLVEFEGYIAGENEYLPEYISSRITFIPPVINTEIVAVEYDCCQGIRGNFDGDELDEIDIADLVYLVEFQFFGGPAAPCFDEGNVDGIDVIDIADLVYMVEFQFLGGPPPPDCP